MVGQGTEKNLNADSNKSESPIIKPGRILGRVFDADSGEALIGVTVVIEESKTETKTDLEGRYRLTGVKPGNYSLLFFKESYERVRVKVDQVESGRTKLVDLPLNPDYSDLETLDAFEITSEELGGTDIQLLALRQESMVVMDAMGSFDMSRLGAGNVADALTKMVGTSVQDGKYVVVRGLADRYSNATFNGVPIPSSDIYRNTPQLDLFPSIAVDSISIKKSMSPELGAAFAGGSVDVVTKAYPNEFTLNLSVGTKYHQMLFDEDRYLTYESDDQYGFGLDSRSLPAGYEDSTEYETSDRNDPEVVEYMSGFDKDFTLKYVKPELGRSYGFEFGNLIEKKDLSIGILASADLSESYSAKTPIYKQELRYRDDSDNFAVGAGSSFVGKEGVESTELGSYLQTSILLNESNEIGLINLWSHTAEKKAKMNSSIWKKGIGGEETEDDSADPKPIQRFERSWVERDMLINQLYGKHTLTDFHDLGISWKYATTEVSLDEPGTKRIQRGWRPDDDDYYGVPLKQSTQAITRVAPQQVWQSLTDESDFYRVDFETPELTYLKNEYRMKFSFGISRDKFKRNFDESNFEITDASRNRFQYGLDRNFFVPGSWSDFVTPGPQEFPSSGADIHNYFETTDSVLKYVPKIFRDYSGNTQTKAYYVNTQFDLPKDIKISIGVRSEKFSAQAIPGIDKGMEITKYQAQIRNKTAVIDDDRFYPSLAVVKELGDEFKLSINYGKTTARPNLREIAHVESNDPISNNVFKGNPLLIPSEIDNFDARIDWNLADEDIISMSTFFKKIDNPIQGLIANDALNMDIRKINDQVSFPIGGETFVNSKIAELYGFELEGKFGLVSLLDELNGFRIGGNLTWSSSEVSLSNAEKESIQYNKEERMERALEGQSEWIYTVDVSYANEDWGTLSTLVYSFYDSRLHAAFPAGPDDLWEDAYSTFDFIHSHKFGTEQDWKLKFSAKNLTAEDRIVRVRGYDAIEEKYQTSRSYGLSLEKNF